MEFSETELKAMRAEYGKGATDTQWELFISECRARALRPGPHVVFQLRKSKEYDPDTNTSQYVKKPFWITTIGALRLIALRTGQYGGSAPAEYIYLDDNGDPSIISEIPLPSKEHKNLPREPWAVRMSVYRKDFDRPITSVIRFDSVATTQKRGEALTLTDMWAKRGDAQNAKCSEADALRKAFPEELGSLYLSEEIKDAEDEKPHAEIAAPAVVVVPAPPVVPKVNQTPAIPTETPRPTEEEVPAPKTEVVTAVVSPQPPVSTPVEKKEEKTRKPRAKKEPAPPVSGPDAITDEDVDSMLNPTPEDLAANEAIRKNARAAIEEATSFTVDEAVAQGLPAPPDPIPSKEEMTVITAHVRELAAAGASNSDLKDYFLKTGDKTDPKFLSKGEWAKAFVELDKAKAEGTLKEFVKEKK